MSIDTDLRAFLLDDAEIMEAIDTRIYPGGLLPQAADGITSELPAVTMLDIIGDSHITNSAGATCYLPIRYQLEAWAETLTQAREVSRLIRCRIDGYRGQMGERNIGGVFGKSSPAPQYVPNVKVWRILSDYMIHVLS